MEGRGSRGFRIAFPDPGEQCVPKVLAAGQHREAGGFGCGDEVLVFVE